MFMICKKCNTLNSNDAKTCVNCGTKLAGGPSRADKKQSAKPTESRFSPKSSSSSKKQKPVGEKKGSLGKLLIILLIVLAGGTYYLYYLINSGQIDIAYDMAAAMYDEYPKHEKLLVIQLAIA